jgi:hypothetical protein
VPAPQRSLCRADLHALLDQGLHRFGLADRLQFDIEITDRLTPDSRSGKLKRITSWVGPPAGEAARSRIAS